MAKQTENGPSTKIVKPRTKAGQRALEKRAPKIVSLASLFTIRVQNRYLLSQILASMQIEDPRNALFLYGNQTSQVIKDVLTDLSKLKAVGPLKENIST